MMCMDLWEQNMGFFVPNVNVHHRVSIAEDFKKHPSVEDDLVSRW